MVQKLWKYIKGNDLQDPADRRFILCDAKLKKIFDQDRINSFGMNKDLSAHLTKKEEPAKQEEKDVPVDGDTTTATMSDMITNVTTAVETTDTNTAIADTLFAQQLEEVAKEPIVTPKEEDFLLNL